MRPGERVADRYVLADRIGSGGMAEVWRAHDVRLDRDVAIKFLAPQLAQDPEFLVRFFAEAQGVAQISHPNVIQVLDFGEFDDRSYLVMELATGGSAKQLTGSPIAAERAATIVSDAARGAGAAHERGIVHRDIKPGNILLTDDGVAKLADFGIASLSSAAEKLTGTGLTIGSPHYISPEQASGGLATARSDVYSLGVVLYELVTGSKPFDASNVTALAIAHVEQEPPRPSSINPDIPPTLEAIIVRCLAKDASERYPDGSALADALTGSVAGSVVAPVPEPLDEETDSYAVTAAPALAADAAAIEGVAVADGVPLVGDAVFVEEEALPAERRSRVPLVALGLLILAALGAAAFWFTGDHGSRARLPVAHGVTRPSSSPSKHRHRHHKRPSPSTSVAPSVQASIVPVASTVRPSPSAHTTAPPTHKTPKPTPTPKPSPRKSSPRPTPRSSPAPSPSA